MNTFKRVYLPVIAAVVAAFIISAIWYSPMLFGRQWIQLRSEALHVVPNAQIAPWKPFVEFAREILIACVLARFIARLKIDRVSEALSFGLWIWMGFPVAMLVGASLWDNKPWALGLIHGGDWLTKMLAMSVVIVLTRRWTAPRHAPMGEFCGHRAST